MACSKPAVSDDELRYLRLVSLLIQVSPRAVRRCFDAEFHPDQLHNFVIQKRVDITLLRQKNVISKTQYELLYPTGSIEVLSSSFDITLMTCLLKNFTMLSIIDELPSDCLIDAGSDISRIKFFRNVIMHSSNGCLSDEDFATIWQCVSDAIVRLGGNDLEENIKSLQTVTLDTSAKEDIERELYLEKQITEMTERFAILERPTLNILKKHKSTIDLWISANEKFVPVGVTKFLLKQLETQRGVILVGHPGCGKSANAQYVALNMKEKGYEVIPSSRYCDIENYFQPAKRQVFLFNDICGKFCIEQDKADDWTENDDAIGKLLEEEQEVKFIITSRIDVYMNRYFPKLKCLYLKECNFMENARVNTNELKLIAASYLPKEIIRFLTEADINQYCFFPLMCAIYNNMKNPDPDFFKHPTELLRNEILGMRKKNCSSYIALCLLVLHNNKIEKEWFNKDSAYNLQQIIHELCTEAEIRESVFLSSVEIDLRKNLSMYVIDKTTAYATIHDKMFDIISAVIAPQIFKCVLTYGNISFIANRIQFRSLVKQNMSNILLPDELKRQYFERFDDELMKGNYWDVFDNIQTENEQYRQQYLAYLHQVHTSMVYFRFYMNCFYSRKTGPTPLFVSAYKGYLDFVEYLVDKHRYQIRMQEEHGRTPLFIACKNGHMEVVNYLLKFDKHIYQSQNDGVTQFSVACQEGHFEIAKKLLENDEAYHTIDRIKKKPSVKKNRSFRLPDLNRSEKFNELCCALADRNIPQIRFLLHNGANINQKDEYDKTAFLSACRFGLIDIVVLLLFESQSIDNNTNFDAITRRTSSLNKTGVDITFRNKDGWNGLHFASSYGHMGVVKALVKFGMNVNDISKKGFTPLYLACKMGHYDIVDFLMQSEADVYQSDSRKNTPLIIASQHGNEDIVNLLISYGRNIINSENVRKNTALHLACKMGHTKTAKILVGNGAKVNVCNEVGLTPLFYASAFKRRDVINMLIDHGANINRRGITGWTPLQIACCKGYKEIVSQLLEYSADRNACNDIKYSPLKLAKRYEHKEIVNLLKAKSQT